MTDGCNNGGNLAGEEKHMRELSLFSGAGGGLLGTKLLGWKHIGYVEYNDYCQRVIRQRIIDGILDNAPIFGDIRTFISSGCASLYRGVTDVITAGFPCQPFSNAGKRLGADDERNMWLATIECIRLVRPRYALLENVPGLLASGYFGTVLGDLAAAGYDCKWRVLSAAECGAPHLRERVWIFANDRQKRISGSGKETLRRERGIQGSQDVGRIAPSRIRPDLPASQLCRSRNDVADYVDRISAVGNGQVPIVAATAWHLLSEGIV